MLLKSKMINNRDEDDPIRRVCRMKNELIERIEKLGKKLPPNTLDQLIYELGGPEKVAEVNISVNYVFFSIYIILYITCIY